MTGQHLRDLPVFLRAPRAAGLWLAGVLIGLASVVAFALSYRGLFVWALHHQWPMPWPVFFPLLIDVLIVVCEVILFVAAIDGGTPWRVRGLAWLVLLAFTGISVVGNADHAAAADAVTRGGFALPPVVLAIALGFGLGELKRQAAKYRGASAGEDVAGEVLTGGLAGSPATQPVSAGASAGASVPASVKPRLPSLREIQERQGCGQETAKKARAEVQLDRRSRGPLSPSIPGGAPAAQDPPAGVPPQDRPPAPAGVLNGQAAHG